MGLKKYQQKRDFSKTKEPKGKKSPRLGKKKKLYIIQKHAASHLHYDFRLELNGVLLSWAVPKGPCLDPTVKRLAMHVEDHPLEYGSFEGIIPKGQYGGGTVMLWDKGQWIPEDDDPDKAYKKGHLSFVLIGEKLKGRWVLIRMRGDDKTWLLIKAKDEYSKSLKRYNILTAEPDSVKTGRTLDEITEGSKKKVKNKVSPSKKLNLPIRSFPQKISPELATLVDSPPNGPEWLHEIKFDGYRLLAMKKNGKTKLYTRHHHDWSDKFYNIVQAINKLKVKTALFDGEVVVLDENQHSDFQLLQNSIKENTGRPFIYYIFDLLYLDQYDLTQLPLMERKTRLQKLLPVNDKTLRYSDHVIGSGKKIFAKSCELALEGIVSKNSDSPYIQRRTTDWLKAKCIQRQEFIICGFTAPKNSRQFFGALLLGTHNKQGELIYNGNVGTGFTQTSLKSIHQALASLITKEMPFKHKPPGSKYVTWVKPKLVAEIEFIEWTQEGYLRHPSFKGLRGDKPAKMISKEKPMAVKKISKNLKLTNPTKILYPEDKITKEDLANYYSSIQDKILPFITNRLLTLVRCPTTYKSCFYQKHLNESTSDEVFSKMVKGKTQKEEYLFIKNGEGLLALAQLAVLEIHTWGSSVQEYNYPDTLIFDLDPDANLPWKEVVNAALLIKAELAAIKLKCFIKTTGGKGLHVVVPIKPESDWEDIKIFTETFTDYIVMQNPKKYLNTMSKKKRAGKIFIDYLRNVRGATAIAPYSTRARLHAPVATPIHWDELTNDRRDTFFTLKTLPERLASLKSDPWKDYFKIKQSLKLDKFK